MLFHFVSVNVSAHVCVCFYMSFCLHCDMNALLLTKRTINLLMKGVILS
jgi:hypothetical protein